ncbi:hypothetical protein PUMCH_003250 [Australozyma saopauloensis]|uniref:Protein CSF1 n=1 Tax=Australozyma saopauloensis TaxID=291208 RepID=A0AAX4HBX4_9ASCO|nr:hypothetical protein PUMCH_003250 [[Candida] saopauloensis]
MVNPTPFAPDTITSLDSWVYLADWILAVVLGIAFVFYFPRLVGFLISLVLRFSLWKHYKLHLSFHAFRISPLGGRITATNIVLSNSDYTVSILRLNLTWRYWLLSMARISDLLIPSMTQVEETSGLNPELNKKLLTGIEAEIDGLEIFVYNRKFAYENIMSNLERLARELDTELNSDASEKFSNLCAESLSAAKTKDEQAQQNSTHSILHSLPIGFKIKKGALVLGNHTTPHILVASFNSAQASIDLAKTPNPNDKYRLLFDADMERFQVSMKPNITYNPERYIDPKHVSKLASAETTKHSVDLFRKARNILSRVLLRKHREAEKILQEWRGLRRYVGDFKGDPVIEIDNIEEYAKFSLLLDSASTKLLYYFDVPGSNPVSGALSETAPFPEFGVVLELTTANINYGSWTDRQRGAIQALLFPPFARDSEPSLFTNGPGVQRRYAGFNLLIRSTDELVLRIPTREFSKDREELLAQTGTNGPKATRPFGWVEITSGALTEISLFTSYLSDKNGFANKLTVSMPEVEVRTSVTHDILFTADNHTIDCDIGFPLQWNAKCFWNFTMNSKNGIIFFLGEHITFFNDIVSDFSSGPPTKHEFFRAFVYDIRWQISNYRIYLNANDGNVIDDSLDFGTNTYLCLQGPLVEVAASIPANGSFAKYSKIDFSVSTPNLNIYLDVPTSHTIGSFMKGDKRMGSTGHVGITGYYKAYSNIEVNHNNLAFIEATADEVSVLFYGYLARYFFAIKENYFGEYRVFQSCDEYLQTNAKEDAQSEAAEEKQENHDYWNYYKTENDLNVIFSFLVNQGLLIFPCELYDHSHHIGVSFATLDVEIHLTNYYMDLQVDFSPADCYYMKSGTFTSPELVFDMSGYKKLVSSRSPEILIDTFSVHTHRMLGLDSNTYQCKWDFLVGDILIMGDPLCLTGLQAGLQAFGLGFKDYENTHLYAVPIIYDAANFSFRCPRIEAKLDTGVGDLWCKLTLTDILLSFNDIANLRYSDRITVLLPSIIAEIIDSRDDSKFMFVQTSLVFNNICQKATMLEHRISQQNHVRRNDAPTHRAPFIVFEENRDTVYNEASGSRFSTVSLPTASKPLQCGEGQVDEEETRDTLSEDTSSSSYDEYMEPTTNYIDEEFTPQTPPVPGQKTDALILEFAEICGVIHTRGLEAISNLLTKSQNMDLHFLMDRLQCQTVSDIIRLIRLMSVVTNVRFVCPNIDVKLTCADLSDLEQIMRSESSNPVLTLSVSNPSLVATDSLARVRSDYNVVKEVSSALAVHVEEISVVLFARRDSANAFSITLKEFEAWLNNTIEQGVVCSTSLQETEVHVQKDDLDWIIGFIENFHGKLQPAIKNFKQFSETSESWKKQLAVLLSPTGGVLEQQTDPKVITKPSRLHRSVIDHVRFFDSWKVISKFRSLLNDLNSFDAANVQFINRDWDLPPDALVSVINSYKGWRAWEGNQDERRAFFESLFSKPPATNSPMKASLKLASLGLSFLDQDDCKDFLSIREFNVTWMKSWQSATASDDHKQSMSQISPVNDLSFNVNDCDLSVSPRIICVVEKISQVLDNTGDNETKANAENGKLSAILNIESFQFHLALFHTTINYFMSETSVLFLSCQTIDRNELTASLTSGQSNLSLGRSEQDFVSIHQKGLSMVLAGSLNVIPILAIKLDTKEFSIEVRDYERLFNHYLRSLAEDIECVKGLNLFSHKVKEGPSNSASPVPEILLEISTQKISLFADFLLPAKIHLVSRDAKLQASIRNDLFDIQTGYKNTSLEIVVADELVARMESSRFGSSSVVQKINGFWFVKSDVNLGYFKISMQQFIDVCRVLLENKSMMELELYKLKDAADAFSQTSKNEKVCETDGHSEKVVFELQINQEYCGFLTYINSCRYSVEIEGLVLSFTNVGEELGIMAPICGEVICSGARFSVLDPLFAVGLSTVVDVNLSAKLINDSKDVLGPGPSQSIQIVSNHFRVCLSPPVIYKILDFSEGLKRLMPQYESLFKTKTSPKGVKAHSQAPLENREPLNRNIENKSQSLPSISSIHVLSYNFCIGWLFGKSFKDYPGFICGAERLFGVTRSEIGKLTMMGGYFSVANGSTASSFFSTSSEMHGLNRAFMPKLQINYFVDEVRKLWINVKGDQLDARFMSNSKIAMERTMKSITEIRNFMEIKHEQAHHPILVSTTDSKASIEKPRSFRPDYSGVEVSIGFAGSKIFLYRLQENDLNETPSSLTLHCPAVLSVILYELHKERQRKHLLRVELLISQSDNTLYPSCVPVMSDFAKTFKSLFQSPQTDRASSVVEVKSVPQKDETGLKDFQKMLVDFDFHIGVRIDPQKVSLSCEPIAKVAAVVEFEGASIAVSSGVSLDTINAICKANSISASLQHIYSDDRSGIIEVRDILFSNVLSLKHPVENISSIDISGIHGYVKMKQYQDVDLFSDIWFPSSNLDENSDLAPRKAPQLAHNAAKSKRSETITTIIVQLDFIISEVSIEVDFGSALGVVKLGIDRAWAISQKSSAWHYALNLGLQTLSLDVSGRLGGYLRLRKLFLNSSIQWRLGELPILDVPLIHMAGGFGQISVKAIFDDHVFAIVSLANWFFDVYNRKNGIDISKDHLHVRLKYESVDVSLTSLSASDFYDIYSTINRMIEENRRSYKEILKDSNEDDAVSAKLAQFAVNKMKRLETEIEVETGLTRLQVFPHSFVDTRVFVLECDLSKANFSQNEYSLGVMNQIELQLNNVNASFSSIAGASEEFVTESDVEEFVAYIGKAKGGEIISLPKFMISMRTYQKFETSIIEYMFQSSFGGTVNIRWNLGSVNCVRDMYAAHKRALLSRTEANHLRLESTRTDPDRRRSSLAMSASTSMNSFSTFAEPLEPGVIHKDFDQDIQDTLDKVSNTSKFTYVALAPPIIEAPKLRELGNATPPLEWFGLHRNKFPDAVHQLAIVTLQKLIREIEQEYSKTLGKA